MSLFKRTKTQNNLPVNNGIRRFSRHKLTTINQQVYQQGIQSIIKCRFWLQLQADTIFMSIDIFKQYLFKLLDIPYKQLVTVCIACVWLAAKANQIYPPDMKQITEAFDYFEKTQSIIKKEAQIMKQLDYLIPYQNNLITILHENLTQHNICDVLEVQNYIRMLYKFIADPFFIHVKNNIIIKSLLFIQNQKRQEKKESNKQIANMSEFIKKKIKFKKINKDIGTFNVYGHIGILKQLNLNTQNKI